MQIYEDMPGAKATATSLSIDYNIIHAPTSANPATDEAFVRAALLAYAPITNAPPGSAYAWPRRAMQLDEKGPGIWKATITWAVLNYQYAFKIGGSSQQIRADRVLSGFYKDPAGASTDFPAYAVLDKGRPIGWDGRNVHGTSIWVPTVSWTESVEIPAAQFTFDYEDAVTRVAMAPLNNALFRGYPAYCVRFNGMNSNVSAQNPDFVAATYDFEFSPPADTSGDWLPPIQIDDITGIIKLGWDQLDVHYPGPQCPVGATTMQPPKALFVLTHVVYQNCDFAALKIGTGESLPLWTG